MQAYIYESMWTQDLEDAVEASIAKPLVLEMFYKYGLKVISWQKSYKYNYSEGVHEYLDNKDCFILSLDGMPACSVMAEEITDKDNKLKTEYSVYSKTIQKDRGRDDADRHTLRSVKLSQLIKTLEKRKIIDNLGIPLIGMVRSLLHTTSRNMEIKADIKGITSSGSEVEAIHALLKVFYGEMQKDNLSSDNVTNGKLLLDSLNKLDENNKTHIAELSRIYSDFYLLYTDASDGYVVTKIKVTLGNDARDIISRDSDIEELTTTQRVLRLEDHPDFADFGGTMTMFKVWLEDSANNRGYSLVKDMFPERDTYWKEFNITSYYRDINSQHDGVYLCIPMN
jgi:hypothetical protein